jgi:hypothetical protein
MGSNPAVPTKALAGSSPRGGERSNRMTRVPLYMHKVATWDVTNTGLTARAAEVPHLETHRVQLEAKLELFKALSTQHAVLTTSKQEIGKQMRMLFREVETLLHYLRTGIRQHYCR